MMPAFITNIGGATTPALPVETVLRRLLRVLGQAVDRLVPQHPDRHPAPPPEFYNYPPF
jgi:hypothetical protein